MSITVGRPVVMLDRHGSRNAGSGAIMSVNGRTVEVEHITKTVSIPLTSAQSASVTDDFVVEQIVTELAAALISGGLVRVEKVENLSKACIDYRGVIFVERGAILSPTPKESPPDVLLPKPSPNPPIVVNIKHEQDERPSKGPSLESLLGSED